MVLFLKKSYDGSAWHVETADDAPNVGIETSLVLDADRPHISYHHYTDGDLRYAFHDAVAWQIEAVDGPGRVGQASSLVLDGTGFSHISYYDQTPGDPKYASAVQGQRVYLPIVWRTR